jgi:hypothetical protein
MLSFLKKIFGPKSTEASPAPYKVEAPTAPVVTATTTEATPTKKPAAKKAVTAKPKAPRKPRASKA